MIRPPPSSTSFPSPPLFRFFDAVAALGVAGHLPMGRLAGLLVEMIAAVVHPEAVAVVEDGEIRARVSLPRPVSDQDDLARRRDRKSTRRTPVTVKSRMPPSA